MSAWSRWVLALPASDELRLALAPDTTYRALVDERADASLTQLLTRAATGNVALIVIIPVMVTGRITPGLLATSALCWSFVGVLQLLLGAGLIASAPRRRVGVMRGLELWFVAHLPFSIWCLAVGSWASNADRLTQQWALCTALVPGVWTMVLITAYCRVVLGTTVSGALRRLAVQQLLAWSLVAAYILLGAGGSSALVGFVARQLGLRG